jgi:hypothetical protein
MSAPSPAVRVSTGYALPLRCPGEYINPPYSVATSADLVRRVTDGFAGKDAVDKQ